jgi:flagellar basal-body rod modification protein FlgD
MDPVTSPTTAPAAAATRSARGADSAATLAGDFNTFLTLLTAQLRNQDPLKPADSTEFVAQLAQFAGVEQQIRTNDRIDALAAALAGDGAEGLASWIGMEVRAAAAVPWAASPLSLSARPEPGAELAVLVVRDATGTERARLTVDPAAAEIAWNGEGTTGTLPEGVYRFEIESFRAGEKIATRPVEVFAEVAEVRREAGATVLVLADGTRLPADAVSALRRAG